MGMPGRKPNGAGRDPTLGFRIPRPSIVAIDDLAKAMKCHRSKAARLVIERGIEAVRRELGPARARLPRGTRPASASAA